MVLLEAVKGGRTGLKVEKPLCIYNKDGSYTDEMKAIYECIGDCRGPSEEFPYLSFS